MGFVLGVLLSSYVYYFWVFKGLVSLCFSVGLFVLASIFSIILVGNILLLFSMLCDRDVRG